MKELFSLKETKNRFPSVFYFAYEYETRKVFISAFDKPHNNPLFWLRKGHNAPEPTLSIEQFNVELNKNWLVMTDFYLFDMEKEFWKFKSKSHRMPDLEFLDNTVIVKGTEWGYDSDGEWIKTYNYQGELLETTYISTAYN